MVTFAFYLFASAAVLGGLMTVIGRNPVHSVLWLILAFLSSAGLFVLLGAEFVAMLLIIVYVGAVAVLFLFVVMMLDVDFAALKAEMAQYMPLALLIGVVILMELGLAFGVWEFSDQAENLRAHVTPAASEAHNTAALGNIGSADPREHGQGTKLAYHTTKLVARRWLQRQSCAIRARRARPTIPRGIVSAAGWTVQSLGGLGCHAAARSRCSLPCIHRERRISRGAGASRAHQALIATSSTDQ